MRFHSLFLILFAVSLSIANCAAASKADKIETRYGQVYCQRDSGPLKADVYIPQGDGPFPGVLVVHGGAWHLGTRAQLSGAAQRLAENGFTAVAISYRLAPKHKFPAQIEDCKEAIRWMRNSAESLKLNPDRIGGYGYSAGAQLVTLLGTTDPNDGLEGETSIEGQSTRLQAIACGGAPCEFRVLPANERRLSFWLGGSRAEVPDQYYLASPAAFISPDDPPMFFFHAENDTLVPIASPKLMVRELSNAGIESELYVVKNNGHVFAMLDRTALRKSVDFLKKHLVEEGQIARNP